MQGNNEFAHGTYGDIAGVTFSGPPRNGFWDDNFAVSDRFIFPLFNAILDRSDDPPQVVTEWNGQGGWTDEPRVELSPAAANALVLALENLAEIDVAPYCGAATTDECIRCAASIRAFINDHLAKGSPIFLQKD